MPSLELDEILDILPHRYPFLFVDRILECDDENRIVGIKNLTFNEPFFQGHFPGRPIMPGVVQLEAMAQVAGILMNRHAEREGQVAYLTKVDKARFRKPLVPGDTLHIEVEFVKLKMRIAVVTAIVKLEGEVVSEAELMFASA